MNIQYQKEGQEIIKKVEDLMPWDKADLLKYLIDKVLTWEEFYKYFIEGLYVDPDTIDNVREVINNGEETEVLDEMREEEICDYLLNTSNAADNIKYMIENAYTNELAELFADLPDDDLVDIFDEIKENHKEAYVKIAKHMVGIKD